MKGFQLLGRDISVAQGGTNPKDPDAFHVKQADLGKPDMPAMVKDSPQ